MSAGEDKRTMWADLRRAEPGTEAAETAYADEARIAAFRGLVYRLRTEASLTQAELAERMGTTQSAIARIEGGGTRPTLDTLEKLATAVGADLVVGSARISQPIAPSPNPNVKATRSSDEPADDAPLRLSHRPVSGGIRASRPGNQGGGGHGEELR